MYIVYYIYYKQLRNKTTLLSSGESLNIETTGRYGEVERKTKETQVSIRVNLDGSGQCRA